MKIVLFFESAFDETLQQSVSSHYIYAEGIDPEIHTHVHEDVTRSVYAYYKGLNYAVGSLLKLLDENPELNAEALEVYFSRKEAHDSFFMWEPEKKLKGPMQKAFVFNIMQEIDRYFWDVTYRNEEDSPELYKQISNNLLEQSTEQIELIKDKILAKESQRRLIIKAMKKAIKIRQDDRKAQFAIIKKQRAKEELEFRQTLDGGYEKGYIPSDKISLVVDAGCSRDRYRKGSIAGAIIKDGEIESFGSRHSGLNSANEYEHLAINIGLESILNDLEEDASIDINIYTDSSTTLNIITGANQKKHKHEDLLKVTDELIAKYQGRIQFFKVKSHAPNYKANEVEAIHNEVDKLASTILKRKKRHQISQELI